MIYVLYGEETFLLEQKLKDIQKEYDISKENMNLAVYDGNESLLKDIIEDCNTPPFLTDYKMVLLKNPVFLTTQKKSDSNNDTSLLEKYIKKPLNSTILVIYHNVKNFDERKKIVKLLKKETTYLLLDKVGHA